jgi:hypothetical protein
MGQGRSLRELASDSVIRAQAPTFFLTVLDQLKGG